MAAKQGLQGWTAVSVQPGQVEKILQQDEKVLSEKMDINILLCYTYKKWLFDIWEAGIFWVP